MRTIEQIMEDHLYIEYKFGSKITDDKMLSERHGYISQIDDYINELERWLNPKLKQLEEPGDVITLIIDNPYDIWESPFFQHCHIRFNLGLTYTGSHISGGYIPSDYDNVKMDITVKHINISFIKKKLLIAFAHELTHAYDDYSRRLKGGESMKMHMSKTGYKQVLDSMDNPVYANEVAIANVFYKLNASERNALIGMLKPDIMNLPVATSSSEALKRIQVTESWKRVKMMRDAIDTINSLIEGEDDATIQDILSSVNRFSRTTFTTFKQFKKVLNRRWNNWYKQYMTQASKIVYDVMMDKKPMTIDEGVNWPEEDELKIRILEK